MKPERFKRTKSVVAASAIALVAAALVMGLSSLVLGPRSAYPQRPGFDLTSNPSTFTITSAIYASPTCSGSPALLFPGTTRCAVFTVHNLLNVPITVQSITSALDGSFTAPPANCAPPTHFTLPTFSGMATVAAGATAALPGVPIKLLDNGNQDNCRNFTYHFTYTGSAQYTDSTSTTLSSTPNPSSLGQSVTFNATVSAGNPSTDTSPPSGTVSFYKCTSATVCPNTSTNLLGTGTISGGVANFSTTTLPQGVTWVDAVYPASGTNFTGSTSSVVTQDVVAGTTTTLTSAPNPSVSGSSVTFTATVTKTGGTGTPTGNVSFYSGTPTGSHTLLATKPLNASAVATYSTTSLALGTDPIYAVYGGDTNFSGSTSPVLNQRVVSSACINGTINGGYTVASGQFICITGRVNGGVTVKSGGGLFLSGATINGGTLSATGASSLTFCGSTINGNISISGTTGPVLIGDGGDNQPAGDDPLPACGANTLTGSSISITNNTGGVEFGGNQVTGSVTLTGNTNAVGPEIEANKITGSLSCSGNVAAPTNDGLKNTVTGTKSGQCAGERVLMARRKHHMVPTDQMVPADPITEQLPLDVPTAPESGDYWARAMGKTPTSPARSTEQRAGTDNSTKGLANSAESGREYTYWDRARGAAARRPERPERTAESPKPATAVTVTPPVPKSVTEDSLGVPTLLAATEPAPVLMQGLTAVQSEGKAHGPLVRHNDPLVGEVRGAHVKADDPLVGAAWDAHVSTDDALVAKVRGAHLVADDPMAAEDMAVPAAKAPVRRAEDQAYLTEPALDEAASSKGRRAAHAKSRRRHWRLVPVGGAAVALAAGLGGGAAYAYFSSTGSGTGHATTGSATGITATAVGAPVADANLYPGAPGVAVHFTVNNPNPYAVTFTGWSGATLSTVTPIGSNTCTTGDFQIAAASGSFSPTLSIPANTPSSPGVSGTANGVVQLTTTAQNGCQGAKIIVTLTLTGGKSS